MDYNDLHKCVHSLLKRLPAPPRHRNPQKHHSANEKCGKASKSGARASDPSALRSEDDGFRCGFLS
ncbi:hypothetical protein M407DRAFT_247121 [Tulasnella calospora MUT 4182]|uniref:Uncharacterized protein n=1 Tax=Tulasnella calospora MUT 4182 TaxID=1051891 RepID=A0A0C3PNG4_9AGAM|nr:hypothetical protein M407DRAFT_247121 [Tulasnella calospora MUT 4182]